MTYNMYDTGNLGPCTMYLKENNNTHVHQAKPRKIVNPVILF